MTVGNNCDMCIHSKVCVMKFTVKDAIKTYEQVHLTVCCDQFMAAEPKTVQPRKVVRRNVVRKAKT